MATAVETTPTIRPFRRQWYSHLYVQVLTAIVLGVLLGHFYPSLGEQMKPLGDAFIKCIKMIIAPIIFLTVVHGIASMRDMKKVGRVGLKALIYFELVTTAALIVGLIVVNLWKPGAIKAIKMVIAPIIFFTVVHGIASDEGHEEGRPRRPQGADLFRARRRRPR